MLQTRVLNKYTPDEMSEADFLKRFVVREDIYEQIFSDIKESDYTAPQQSYIIVGQRGQGKTTLLRRVQIGVQQDRSLAEWLIPIKFPEEQYQIRTLGRLWEEIADTLQNDYDETYPTLFDDMEKHFEEDEYDEICFKMLDTAVRKSKQKLLLLIDNIDELLNKFSIKEQRRLREILITCPTFRIIGGSSNMLEQHFDYGKPFYEFFRIEKLTSFNSEETNRFLKALAEGDELERITEVIEKTPERIELLRRLTGGVPRTIVMLFDIFLDDEGTAFNDLLKILDEVTPLYKHRMDDLPGQLQTIMDAIAMNWDGIATKEIAKKTRLQSKQVSAQLKMLEKNEIIISEAIGKNKIYKIKERFFNIWYLMRFGRKRDRQRVEWLVKFLEAWCTPEELQQRAEKLIRSLNNGTTKEYHAFHMSEALCYAGLDLDTEHELKNSARLFFEAKGSSLAKELTPSNYDIYSHIVQLAQNDVDQAIEQLDKSVLGSEHKKVFKALLLLSKSDYGAAISLFDELLEAKSSAFILIPQALAYIYSQNYSHAITLLHNAINCDDFQETGTYWVSNGFSAYRLLGDSYYELKDYENAEEYYKLAIERGDKQSLFNLGIIYYSKGDTEKAIKHLEKAVDNNIEGSHKQLALIYLGLREYEQTDKLLQVAINNSDTSALGILAFVKRAQGNFPEAERLFLEVIANGYTEFYNSLAKLYHLMEKRKKAEEYYIKGIDEDDNDARAYYSWFLYEEGKAPEESLKHISKALPSINDLDNTHSFAVIQLWNDFFTESYQTFIDWLTEYPEALENEEGITEYLTLLLAKKQLNRTRKLFEIPEFQLKDRYKPFWYALAKLMGDEMRVEVAKMGSELEESVDEIIEKVSKYSEKYR